MDISLPALENFVDQLIAEKFSGQTLDDAVRADIKRELTDKLNQYLTLRTIEIVSETNPDAIKFFWVGSSVSKRFNPTGFS